jgi:phosphatidylserine/phosphatidylglycerophosphate/cardiolipin synthase-like enzyme
VVREAHQLDNCGRSGRALIRVASRIVDYGGSDFTTDETFHAKIVLADGVAAYVGSANLPRIPRMKRRF